jgi:hypothetical protein
LEIRFKRINEAGFLNSEKNMAEDDFTNSSVERRSEARKETNSIYGAELQVPDAPIHRFKFKDISPNGACVVIKEDSSMLNHLRAGQKLNMKYNSPIILGTPTLKSEIRHITKAQQGRFKGHYLVGVLISEK